MHRPLTTATTALAVVVALVASCLTPLAAQEAPPDLPPGFTDGRPVGGDDPPPADDPAAVEADAETAPVPTDELRAEAVQPAATQRYFGRQPYQAVRSAVSATTRSCTIADDVLTAMVLAPVFKESSAATTPASAPSPMTLSRYDEWNGLLWPETNASANYGLYAFRDAYTPYQRAYWHPGIGIWQYDSAGVGAPFTAVERMHVGTVAADVARIMSSRYCAASGTAEQRRYEAWRDWGFPCTLCKGFYDEMMGTAPPFANLGLVDGIGVLGGVVERTCSLPGVAGTVRCWYVDPSVGTIQGATAWATVSPTGGSGPTVAPAPLSRPFYVVDRGTTEQRYWLRADTGYAIDITASRQIGKNARPRSSQAGSGLTWSQGGLCDLTAGRGTCTATAPAGLTGTTFAISATYQPHALDIDGDSQGDLLFYRPGAGIDAIWLGTGAGTFSTRTMAVNATYDHVLTGQIDGAHGDEVLWYSSTSGRAALWRSTGDDDFESSTLSVGPGRQPFLIDTDADGADEIFWYGPGTVPDARWRWTGSGFHATAYVINRAYEPIVGDFDRNGREDVFWYARGTAPDAVWFHSQAGTLATKTETVNGTYDWRVGDFDGDNDDDILWYAPGAAGDALWWGAPGGQFVKSGLNVTLSYQPVVVDLDGSGRDGIIWYAPGTRQDHWWRWSADGVLGSEPVELPGTYVPVVGAFSAGGAPGVLWYAPGTQPDVLWYR